MRLIRRGTRTDWEDWGSAVIGADPDVHLLHDGDRPIKQVRESADREPTDRQVASPHSEMTTRRKAAVFHEPRRPLTIEDVQDAPLKRREVLVRTAFVGLCHWDPHFMERLCPLPTLSVLGHEAAGVIEAVGGEVIYLKLGDHVITCLSVFCGECPQYMTGHPKVCENTEVKLQPVWRVASPEG
jgi:hypothetical protein